MIRRFLLPAAVMALSGGIAQAQISTGIGAAPNIAQGGGITASPGAAIANVPGLRGPISQVNPFFIGSTPFQFVPGVGFAPLGAFGTGQFPSPAAGIANQPGLYGFPASGYVFGSPLDNLGTGLFPGTGTGFFPGAGSGFFSPYYPGMFSTGIPTYPRAEQLLPPLPVGAVPPVWNQAVIANRIARAARLQAQAQQQALNGTAIARRSAPVAGPRIPTEVAVVPGTNVGQELVAGSRQETTDPLVVDTGVVTAMELRASRQIQDVMENRAITEGELIRLGATGAQVRITLNGEVRTERYPIENVFFFGSDGRLTTAAQAPDLVVPGASVLVPVPAGTETEQVAGSRETIRNNNTPPKK